jgi:hypothetical protein
VAKMGTQARRIIAQAYHVSVFRSSKLTSDSRNLVFVSTGRWQTERTDNGFLLKTALNMLKLDYGVKQRRRMRNFCYATATNCWHESGWWLLVEYNILTARRIACILRCRSRMAYAYSWIYILFGY